MLKIIFSCHPERSEGSQLFEERDSSLRPEHHAVQGFAQNDKPRALTFSAP
jgi:hypothetical protein